MNLYWPILWWLIIIKPDILVDCVFQSSTVSSTMDMGNMGGMGGNGHRHGGLEMDMNDTDRTCSGHMLVILSYLYV